MLGIGILFVLGCSGKKDYVKKGETVDTMEQNMVQKKFIEAIGMCGADKALDSVQQRRADSRDCCKTKAQGSLAELIHGIELEGGVRVERAIVADSVLQSKLDASIKGAEVVKTEWTKDDGCVMTMRLDRKRLQEMMGVQFK